MSDFAKLVSDGGQKTAAVAAGTTGADAVISAKPGRITRIVITTAGTATLELYDHATATSGAKLVWKSPDTVAVDTDNAVLDIPVANGIVALKANGSAAVTVYFTEDETAGLGAYDKLALLNKGGQYTSYHAAGSTGASAALATPGRLCRLVVLSAGSAATVIYDSASAASGTKLFTLKATPTVGAVYDLQAPAAAGIYVGGATNTSALLVCYAKDGANGKAS